MNQHFSILWHYLATKRNGHRWRTRAELEAWQDRVVQKHLARILPRSPFYRQLYAGRSLANWRDFPIVSKAELMANFEYWNTAGIHRAAAETVALHGEHSRDFSPMIGNITVGLSSGTSGKRGLFLVSPAERYAWAGTVLAKILPHGLLERQRAALCFRANSNLYGSVSSRRFQFGFFDLLEPLEQLSAKLAAFAPTLLIAPPAMLRLLAEEKRAGRLKIQPVRIISVAEVLEPQERVFIEKQFGQRVHEIYQATEGFIAATCAHGTLHLNEDNLVVQKEWLDQSAGKFMPIITDFRRITQPIMRYRLNDILTECNIHCPCGSILAAIGKIEGRSDDLLQFASLQLEQTVLVFPDFIRRAIITADDAITEYSVKHWPNGKLEIALEVPNEHRARAEQSISIGLASLCETLHCQCPQIDFVPFSSPSFNVKLRRIQCVL